jgi:hypothetical protein
MKSNVRNQSWNILVGCGKILGLKFYRISDSDLLDCINFYHIKRKEKYFWDHKNMKIKMVLLILSFMKKKRN